MNFKTLVAGSVCSVALLFSSVAQAAVIQWNLNGVTLNDGGTIAGTFSTDSDSGNLVSFDITTTLGTQQNGFHYTNASSRILGNNIYGPNSFAVANVNPSLQPLLQLSFANSLNQTNASNSLVGHFNRFGGTLECTANTCTNLRTITAGYAQSVTPVPEAETYAMMLAGLGLLGFMARRKKNVRIS